MKRSAIYFGFILIISVLFLKQVQGAQFSTLKNHIEYESIETMFAGKIIPHFISPAHFYDEEDKTTKAPVDEEDSLALVALYNSTNGDIWKNKENWLNGAVSTWDGITVTDGRVTGIDLGMNNMIGQLPSEIGNLNKLRVLKFHNNHIHGPIPPGIGSLDSLRVLFLYNNDFEGSIPSEIVNLSELQELRLNSNQLIGSIPEEIYNLTNLELLMLSHNELTGNLSPAVGNLTKLTWLEVRNNQLEDSIPSEVVNLTNLQYFYINNNYFNYLPDLSSLSALSNFYVEDNNLDFSDLQMADVVAPNYSYAPQRQIPVDTTQMNDQIVFESLDEGVNNNYQWYNADMALPEDTLDTLAVSTADDGAYYCYITNDSFPDLTLQTIPQGVGNISLTKGILTNEYEALVSLYDSTNGTGWDNSHNWKTDHDIEYWYGISVEGVHVTSIRLGSNGLEGTIPADIGEFSKLTRLELGDQLTGEIPAGIYGLTDLEILTLGSNQLTGTISSDINNLSMLKKFVIYDNNFVDFPDLSSLANIEFLNIRENQFTFEDIEPNIGVSSGSFYYSPQAMIGEVVSLAPNTGAPVELSVSVGGEQNVYQWYKDGIAIPDSDSPVFTIQTFDSDSAGVYKCEITNDIATALTLESGNMYVDVPISTFNIDLNVDPLGAGTVNGDGVYEDGETVIVSATPNEGYSFKKWGEEKSYSSRDSVYSFTAKEDVTLTASFEPLPSFAISANVEPEGSGSVNGAKDYYKDETATLEAIAENGFEFVNWKESDTVISTDPVLSIKVYRARSFVANFGEATAIDDKQKNEIQVYPNPVKNELIVQGIEETAEVKLYDLKGSLIKAIKISENHSINLGDLPSGFYLLHIQNKEVSIVRKIIIDK